MLINLFCQLHAYQLMTMNCKFQNKVKMIMLSQRFCQQSILLYVPKPCRSSNPVLLIIIIIIISLLNVFYFNFSSTKGFVLTESQGRTNQMRSCIWTIEQTVSDLAVRSFG